MGSGSGTVILAYEIIPLQLGIVIPLCTANDQEIWVNAYLKMENFIHPSTVLEKYMAQSLHIGLYWPLTKLPFGISAIYFDQKRYPFVVPNQLPNFIDPPPRARRYVCKSNKKNIATSRHITTTGCDFSLSRVKICCRVTVKQRSFAGADGIPRMANQKKKGYQDETFKTQKV